MATLPSQPPLPLLERSVLLPSTSIMTLQSDSEKTIRKFDIAQVSYCLQDRLGLAKIKLQYGGLHGLKLRDNKSGPSDNEKPSDSSSTISRSRCETPITSPPIETATYSRELLRSARSKHAVMFDERVLTATQPMLTAKRSRSDSFSERPAKTRVSWKSNHRLPQSSPGHQSLPYHRRTHTPFMSEAPIAELSSPTFHNPSDEENDPDLPLHSFRQMSSMAGSSPPRTPKPRHAGLPRADHAFDRENGADLLMYLANSPTPARVAVGSHLLFPPSTPPSQHTGLPHLTPNIGTPGQPLNFADFVNVTPSPAQPPWQPSRTPLFTKDARKKLDFESMLPPPASPRAGLSMVPASPRGLALKFQLGGELKR